MKSTILMGSQIGNNVIIGANSVVSGIIPDNSVVGGNPAKVICSLEEFVDKRRKRAIKDAVFCVKRTYQNTGKLPSISQMGDGFAWLYLPRSSESLCNYPQFFALKGDDEEKIIQNFMASKPAFDSFDSFLAYAMNEIEKENNR